MERNIYQRKDKRWEGRIYRETQDGKRKYQAFFGKTREEVQQKMTDFRSRFAICAEKTVLFAEVMSEWFQSVQYRIKESTAANYRMKADKHILPAFGEENIADISQNMIYGFIKNKQDSRLSNRYISDILVLMKSVFKYAVRCYHIVNPMDGITMPRKTKPNIRLLDETEQKKLQQYINENQNLTTAGIALTMATGLRIGELCALQWKDIDLEKRILTVRKTLQRIQVKGGKNKTKIIITDPKSESSVRNIPIPDFMVEILQKFQGKSENFLLSGTEKPVEPRTIQYRFAGILKSVNLPSVHFHALRHMFASKCIKLGFDVKALSEILGHSSVEITLNRYVHSSFEQKIEYMNRLKPAA